MKRFIYYLFPLLALTFTACGGSENDDLEEPSKPSTPSEPAKPKLTELSFTTTVQTRALPEVLTELKSGAQMSIFVTFSNNTAITTMSKAICGSDGIFKASPSIELTAGVIASFNAVYPYNSNNTSASAIPVSVANQTDYLYSNGTATASKSNPTASITMHHAMSVFAFNIDKKGYTGAGKLQEVKLSGDGMFTEGKLDINTGSIAGTTKGEYAKSFNETLQAGGFTTNIPAMFVIPSTSNGSNYQITIKVDGKEYTATLPKQSVSGGTKYLFRMALTERELVVFPEMTDVVSLNANTDDMPERELSTLQVTHTNKKMATPVVGGSDGMFGKIYWGDGQSEDYKSKASHTYAEQGTHTIAIESWGAQDVTIESLSGVTEIDLSKF